MSKYLAVSGLLATRLHHGDYLLKDFPTDRQLSAELEVDARTARKAVARLIDAGLLVRQPNGRPVAVGQRGVARSQANAPSAQRHQTESASVLRVALLSVAYPSPNTWRWQRAIQACVQAHGALLRPVSYVHLDDAVVGDTLDGFDAVFLGLPGGDPSDHLLRTVVRSGKPVVVLDTDVSDKGLPSLWLASPTAVVKLMEHLEQRGHEKIACLNTQPHNNVTQQRIATWRTWTQVHNRAGRLVDRPVQPFESPMEQAYQATLEVLSDGGFGATSLLCCTSAAAKGVYRAMHERGQDVGEHLAVCSADDGAGEAPFFIPSLTSLRDPDPRPYLEICLAWMERGGLGWEGPLLVQPDNVPLFIGESTGMAAGRV